MENRKFKVGDKVCIPKTKSVRGWGGIKESYHVKLAKKNKQDHMYVICWDEDGYYNVSDNQADETGDFFLESDLDLYVEPSTYESKTTLYPVQEKVEAIVINPSKESKEVDYISKALQVIIDKDYEFSKELANLINYLASTYADKYESDDSNIKSKDILLSKEGKAANIFTASKYLQRYNTYNFEKSENIKDLYKSVHYIIFELQRKNKHA